MQKTKILPHQWLQLKSEGENALNNGFLYDNERVLLKELSLSAMRTVDLLRKLRWTIDGIFQVVTEKAIRLEWIEVTNQNPEERQMIPDFFAQEKDEFEEVDEASALKKLKERYGEPEHEAPVESLEPKPVEEKNTSSDIVNLAEEEEKLLRLMGFTNTPVEHTYQRAEDAPEKIEVPEYGFGKEPQPPAKPNTAEVPAAQKKSYENMSEAERSRAQSRERLLEESRRLSAQRREAQQRAIENKEKLKSQQEEQQKAWAERNNKMKEEEKRKFGSSLLGRMSALKKFQEKPVDKAEE